MIHVQVLALMNLLKGIDYYSSKQLVNYSVKRRPQVEISSKSPVSLYVQLKDYLVQEIKSHRLNPNDQIPSERELCDKFSVSRTTVRQAIRLAINEGLLYSIHGKGTFVAEPKIDQGLIRLTGFEETIKGRGLTPSMKVLEARLISADVHITSLLGLPVGSDIASFKLLGIANNTPMVLFYYYLPTALGLEAIEHVRSYEAQKGWFSFTRYYRETKQVDVGSAHQTFEATVATDEQAVLMEYPPGGALFKVTSIIYTREKEPLEVRYAYYRGDYYKFSISRDVGS